MDLSFDWTIVTYSHPGATRRRLAFSCDISQGQQNVSLEKGQAKSETRRAMRCAKKHVKADKERVNKSGQQASQGVLNAVQNF